MIARADFERLVAEMNAQPFEVLEWLDGVGIERDAMEAVLTSGYAQFVQGIYAQRPPSQVLLDLIGNAFRLGWVTRDQYGRPGDDRPDPKPLGSV